MPNRPRPQYPVRTVSRTAEEQAEFAKRMARLSNGIGEDTDEPKAPPPVKLKPRHRLLPVRTYDTQWNEADMEINVTETQLAAIRRAPAFIKAMTALEEGIAQRQENLHALETGVMNAVRQVVAENKVFPTQYVDEYVAAAGQALLAPKRVRQR